MVEHRNELPVAAEPPVPTVLPPETCSSSWSRSMKLGSGGMIT